MTFRSLTDADLRAYIASGEWRERAGAYAIQGIGSGLVRHVDGDYFNVVGLPVAELMRLLASFGVVPSLAARGRLTATCRPGRGYLRRAAK